MGIPILLRDKKLVSKTILPENQRSTVVSLTDAGKKTLDEIRKTQSETFQNVSLSLGLSPEQDEFFKLFIENAITFFDKKLGLKISRPAT
jgi:DNA-binding MarR family transcriptional regulator